MFQKARELRAKRGQLLDKAQKLVEAAEAEDRDLKQEEQTQYDELLSQAEELETRAKRMEAMPMADAGGRQQAPSFNRTHLGDSEERAIAAWARTGDRGAVRDLLTRDDSDGGRESVEIRMPSRRELRAVVDSSMNVTTAGDGGNTVPTGFSGQIATRRNEVRLAERLGVRNVPGVGTTVNFPYESADPEVFATTSEQSDAHGNNYERDALQFGSKAFTLVKKTKKLELTEELMDDEDANLSAFIADSIGRGIGITHNSMLLTEVAANGTALKTFASATAIADGEIEPMVYHDTLAYYLDDGGAIGFVMRPATFGKIKSISANARVYGDTAATVRRTLLEYPVQYSNKAAAIAASAKSLYFGNWYYMGMREDPALRLIRDPYTVDGMTILKYTFRTVYGVLIAGAIGYGVHPSA